MKSKTGIIASLLLLALTSCSVVAKGNSCAAGKINGCQFKASGNLSLQAATQNSAKIIPLRINDETFGDISLYHSKAHSMDSVRGSFSFSNDTHKKVKFKYRVVLKDKKGIVAQTHGHLHLAPGNTQKIKISNIVLRDRDIKNISSYEIQMEGIH